MAEKCGSVPFRAICHALPGGRALWRRAPACGGPSGTSSGRRPASAPTASRNVLKGGRRHARGGLFYEPTVLTGVTAEMAVTREETCGPVTPLVRFTDETDATRMVNDTECGLAAYLFAKDAERVWRVVAALEAGMVGINTGLISNETPPSEASSSRHKGSLHYERPMRSRGLVPCIARRRRALDGGAPCSSAAESLGERCQAARPGRA
nr:aldehyde dehydrogenase family protein [Streptomyces cavernae]